MKRFTTLLLSTLLFFSSIAIFPASAEVQTYRKNGYIYTFKDDGVQILHYVGKNSKVTVPTEIDGYKVVKLGVDEGDEYKEEIDALDYGGFCVNPNVTEVTVPGSVKQIGAGSFSECKNLKNVILGKGITIIPDNMFWHSTNLNSVKIPSTVTYIGVNAFAYCKKLKEIKLPSSVTGIGYNAFYQSGLTKFNVGKNVKDISSNTYVDEVFYGTKIKKITVSKHNKKYSAKNGVLYNKEKTKLIYYPSKKKDKSFVIPKTVEKIAFGAFSGNKNLQSVVISKGVNKIGDNAFSMCSKLSKVKFKTKKKVIVNQSAFWNCTSLKSVFIPKNVTKIKSNAFGITFDGKGKKTKVSGFTIKGYKGTVAEKYAKKNNFKFIAQN